MGSSSRSYLLTSATVRLPVHTPTKSDRNLSDHVMFSLRDRRGAAPLRYRNCTEITVLVCQQKPHPVWETIEKWTGRAKGPLSSRVPLARPVLFWAHTAYKSLLCRPLTSVQFLQIAESRQQSGYLDKGPMEFFLRGCKSWRWHHEEPNKLL